MQHFKGEDNSCRLVKTKKMDKTRLLLFRSDLAKLRSMLTNASNGVEEANLLFEELTRAYPELYTTEEQLPDLVLKPKERIPTSSTRSAASVKQKLQDSIQRPERFQDYSGIDIILDNENTCITTLRELDFAERDAKKRLVYFSSLQGQVLKRLKEISGKKMAQLLKTTSHSRSQAYFLIKFFELVDKNNKLMYSSLPICFFLRVTLR